MEASHEATIAQLNGKIDELKKDIQEKSRIFHLTLSESGDRLEALRSAKETMQEVLTWGSVQGMAKDNLESGIVRINRFLYETPILIGPKAKCSQCGGDGDHTCGGSCRDCKGTGVKK
jgi:hypothetical protein